MKNDRFGAVNILLAEENDILSEELKKMLANLHYGVKTALDRTEALTLAQTGEFHVVIANKGRAGQGFNLHRVLKESGNKLADCFILISGESLDQWETGHVQGEGMTFLEKPFAINALDAVIQAIVAKRRAQEE